MMFGGIGSVNHRQRRRVACLLFTFRPAFRPSPSIAYGSAPTWVETNVHYGYGCACMGVRVASPTKRVLELRNVKVLSLSRCRSDRSLPCR